MKNAAALHTVAWVNKTKKEAETDWKNWKPEQRKKWQADYLEHCAQTAKMILDNANETVTAVNALKEKVKLAIGGAEQIVKAKRASNTPLSDAERSWLEKAKATVDGSAAEFSRLTKLYSDNSPFAYRDGFMEAPLAAGALTGAMVAKIKADRKAGIDVGDQFGKQSPVVARLEEYRKRWATIDAELARLEKARTGHAGEWAKMLTGQIKALQDGQAKWEQDFANDIGKLVNNIKSHFEGNVDSGSDKSFGSSLVKNVKLLVSSKAKEKDRKKAANDALAIEVKLAKWITGLKGVKGGLKTRLKEHESLAASLKDAGPSADPFRVTLEQIRKSLTVREGDVDALTTQVNEAIAELKKVK